MGLSFGQLVGDAGIIASHQRAAENAEIVARQNLLQMQESNRDLQMRAHMDDGVGGAAGTPRQISDAIGQKFVQTPGAEFGTPPAPPAAPLPRQPGGFSPVPDAAVGVRTFDQLRGVPLDQLTGPEFQGLSQPDKTRYISELNQSRMASGDRAAIAEPLAAAADIAVGGVANLAARGLNTIGDTRIGRAVGVGGLKIPTIGGKGSITPFYDMVREKEQANQPLTEAQVLKQLQTRDAANEATRAETAKKSEAGGYESWQLNRKGEPIRELTNNNPTNLRYNSKIGWEGEDGYTETPAGRFGNYASSTAGIRAAVMNAATHFDRGDDTIAKLVTRLSPSNENDTRALITKAAKEMGVAPTTRLNMRDPGVMHRVVDALIKNEIGKNPYPDDLLDEAIRLGLNKLPLPAGGSNSSDQYTSGQLNAMSPAGQAQIAADYNRKYPPAPGEAPVTFPEIYAQTKRIEAGGQTLSGTGLPPNTPPPQAAGVQVPGAPAAPTTTAVATAPARALNRVINTGTPQEVAAAVAAVAVQPATHGTLYGQSTIEPGASNPQVQQILADRAILVSQVAMFHQYGRGDKALEAREKIKAIDLGLYKFQADVGLREGATTGNYSRAMSVASVFAGAPHQVLRRDDGKFDLYINGRVAKAALDSTQIEQFVRTQVDTDYRAQVAALQSSRSAEVFKTDQTIRAETAKQTMETARTLQSEVLKGNFSMAVKNLEMDGWKVVPSGNSDGKAYAYNQVGDVLVINTLDQTVTVNGVKVPVAATGTKVSGMDRSIWGAANTSQPDNREVR